jgi:hypothetical protein
VTYGVKDGMLVEEKTEITGHNMFDNEINNFLKCIESGEKLPSHIDTVIITAGIMQALYDSSAAGREIIF